MARLSFLRLKLTLMEFDFSTESARLANQSGNRLVTVSAHSQHFYMDEIASFNFERPASFMSMQDITPCPALQRFISGYKIIQANNELVNRLLPNTSVAMAFSLRGENAYVNETGTYTLPGITVSGVRNSPRFISYTTNARTLVVLFKEGGASAFFREPIHHLFSESVGLDELVNPSDVETVRDQLGDAPNDYDRIAIVERFLLGLMNGGSTDKLVAAAVQQIHQVNGFVRIKELYDSLCISKDAFEKRFRRIVGASPKQFASIVRMSSIVKQDYRRELMDAAFDAGFFDQSHFIKAFKQFTGQSPTDFRKSGPWW